MVETENRSLEAGMEFGSFFMFVACNALLTNLTFGKGESQTANHFFILCFTYECNLIYVSPLFSFADTKTVKLKVITTCKD